MKKQEEEKQSMLEFLEEKKKENGRLSKTGEWILERLRSGHKGHITPDEMKYILR